MDAVVTRARVRDKRSRLLLAILVLAATVIGCGTAVNGHPLTLTGRWQSTGYQCPSGVSHHEVVDVVQHGVHLVATKVVGDNCVRSHHRTFQGVVVGGTGRVDCWLGAPGLTPAIGVRGAPLTVLGPDKFTLAIPGETMTYTRVRAAVPPPSRSWWWLWALLIAIVLLACLIAVAWRRRGSSIRRQ